jgi:hypothetical protein
MHDEIYFTLFDLGRISKLFLPESIPYGLLEQIDCAVATTFHFNGTARILRMVIWLSLVAFQAKNPAAPYRAQISNTKGRIQIFWFFEDFYGTDPAGRLCEVDHRSCGKAILSCL